MSCNSFQTQICRLYQLAHHAYVAMSLAPDNLRNNIPASDMHSGIVGEERTLRARVLRKRCGSYDVNYLCFWHMLLHNICAYI